MHCKWLVFWFFFFFSAAKRERFRGWGGGWALRDVRHKKHYQALNSAKDENPPGSWYDDLILLK